MSKGKQPFFDGHVSTKADPTHQAFTDFPYHEIDGAPIMDDEDAANAKAQQIARAKAAEVIRRIFCWSTDVKKVKTIKISDPEAARNIEAIGLRFIALAWVFDPALFENSPSAANLAKQLGIKRVPTLQALTGEASRHFGITNRAQAHVWNRAAVGPQKATGRELPAQAGKGQRHAQTRPSGQATPVTSTPHPGRNLLCEGARGQVQSQGQIHAPTDKK